MTPDLLFVYGTLMRGFDHPMAQLLSRSAEFLGGARCRGRLYLVRHYPGLLPSHDVTDVVFGELYRLHRPDELLRELDMYEACGEGFAQPTEYVRQMLEVTRDDGSPIEAWTYLYNWPVAGLPWIALWTIHREVKARHSGARSEPGIAQATVVPGRCGASNPESRGSGSTLSRVPERR